MMRERAVPLARARNEAEWSRMAQVVAAGTEAARSPITKILTMRASRSGEWITGVTASDVRVTKKRDELSEIELALLDEWSGQRT